MGHAAHFLRRLDRVSDAHVELALSLYRDDALLRQVLAAASLPERAERVAISLADPVEGPFVVVTREGRFVTCLGDGMRATDMPVVTRDRLDIAASRVSRMREELGRVRELRESGAEGLAGLAFKRMQQQGPRFAREDVETLLRVQPLIERDVIDKVMQLHELLPAAASALATYRLDDPARLRSKQKDKLLALGDAVWTIAHTLVFFGSRFAQKVLATVEEGHEGGVTAASMLGFLSFEWGTYMHVMRTLWLVGRCGKRALAGVKALPTATMLPMRLYRELALAALAFGSEKLRAEAQKAMITRPTATGDPYFDASANYAATCSEILLPLIANPSKGEAEFLELSRRFAAACASHSDEDPSEEECAAVPDDVARIAWFATSVSVFDESAGNLFGLALGSVPWVVAAAPEQLFLPREWVCRLVPPRSVEEVAAWFKFYVRYRDLAPRRVTHHRAAPKPGRNDPCSCGSGRKHKRCCGAKQGA